MRLWAVLILAVVLCSSVRLLEAVVSSDSDEVDAWDLCPMEAPVGNWSADGTDFPVVNHGGY